MKRVQNVFSCRIVAQRNKMFQNDVYISPVSLMPEEKTPKKPAENTDKQKKKDQKQTEKANTKAAEKLKETTKKPEKKREWKVGIGSTRVQTNDKSMDVSTTGLKIQNKKENFEITLGLSNIREQEKSDSKPKEQSRIGLSGTWKF